MMDYINDMMDYINVRPKADIGLGELGEGVTDVVPVNAVE